MTASSDAFFCQTPRSLAPFDSSQVHLCTLPTCVHGHLMGRGLHRVEVNFAATRWPADDKSIPSSQGAIRPESHCLPVCGIFFCKCNAAPFKRGLYSSHHQLCPSRLSEEHVACSFLLGLPGRSCVYFISTAQLSNALSGDLLVLFILSIMSIADGAESAKTCESSSVRVSISHLSIQG